MGFGERNLVLLQSGVIHGDLQGFFLGNGLLLRKAGGASAYHDHQGGNNGGHFLHFLILLRLWRFLRFFQSFTSFTLFLTYQAKGMAVIRGFIFHLPSLP